MANEYTTPAPCDLADITAEDLCGESLAGIASLMYVGFKNDLVSLPRLKTPGTSADFKLGDYSHIEETPGFVFKTGKCFRKWEIKTESGQFQFSSAGQQKGFIQTLNFGMDSLTPEAAAQFRAINNRKDLFFVIPEGDKFVVIYDPDRNVKIDSGGISFDSGTTADSESGVTVAITLASVSPKTYYTGTVSTTPAV